MHLYQVIAQKVDVWRNAGFPTEEYPVISEILEWASNPNGSGFRLRRPQIRALETYWYLRLVENTPHILNLYKQTFSRTKDLLDALGVPGEAFEKVDYDINTLWEKIVDDDSFVKSFRLDALRETINLDYPSYILALAMGAGKTKLIGAIFATEFAMSLEYPGGPFVQNALVFAPGKIIIESLRELAETEYDRILPPRLYKPFAASIKLTFTRDGEKTIPVIPGSYFNVIVTNTEKIRIQKEKIRKGDLGPIFSDVQEDEAKQEVANARLQAIASLPHLAIFSDEAHHTYGQSLNTGLKKVRITVDYLAEQTNVICVVNTTGTPFFRNQPLRDVVIWYGLSEGIQDNILKEVSGNIQAFSFDDNVEAYLEHVVEDFFKDYGDISLPDGTPAKLAIYFPQTDDVEELRPVIETRLLSIGLSPTLILEHHTSNENKDDFDRFKARNSPHRIALLVNRGVEGWDVPALFSCALARRLRGRNNFVLQAASRCLRQIPGNTKKARIYLSIDNQTILDRQLQETYGETIADLNNSHTRTRTATIFLRKVNIPPLVVKQLVRTVVKKDNGAGKLVLHEPQLDIESFLKKTTYDIQDQESTRSVLAQVGEEIEIYTTPDKTDMYSVAVELAAIYRLDLWTIYDELIHIYGDVKEIPYSHLGVLGKQIEEQTRNYEIQEEVVENALALVKLEGFEQTVDENNAEVYTAEISYPLDREHLLAHWEAWKERDGAFGFHYTPYNFDSNPEMHFLEVMLGHLNLHPTNVDDVYFTGALTDPQKTDFYVEYKGDDGKWHRYTPDFIVRRKDGKCLIVEIKNAQFEAATNNDLERAMLGESALTVEGRKAVASRKWEELNPDRLKYHIIFVREDTLAYDQTLQAKEFIEKE